MNAGLMRSVLFVMFGALGIFAQESTSARRGTPAVNLQSGFASTFQLTLGGTFGAGPAWQNRTTFEFQDVGWKGDAISLSGWMTVDTRDRARNWTAAIAYRSPSVSVGSGRLVVTGGWQRWVFPSVLSGAKDHLVALNGLYRDRWKLPVSISVENWSLVSSPLRKGNLTHVQLNVGHTLAEWDGARLVLRHGPSTTYSHHFYDRPGWRVLRYGGSLVLETGSYVLEGSLRQQGGIAPGVTPNTYWAVMLTRRL